MMAPYFNFERFKSMGERFLLIILEEHVIMVTKMGGSLGQNK